MTITTVGTYTAWDLIGFGGNLDTVHDRDEDMPASVRVRGGRTLYEAVDFFDDTPGTQVRLARLDDFRQINRYVDPDTELELVVTAPAAP